MGLIYGIAIDQSKVDITMTFTTPLCPAGPELVGEVQTKVGALEGVEEVNVDITFDPPWQPSEEVKEELGLV